MIDDFKREGLAIEAGFSLPTARVTRVLDQLLEWHSKPIAIMVPSLPVMNSLIGQKNVVSRVDYIQPGNPQQNAYIERANRTIRYSWLSKYLFETFNEVQDYATKWLWFYNNERPHKANGGRPPLTAA